MTSDAVTVSVSTHAAPHNDFVIPDLIGTGRILHSGCYSKAKEEVDRLDPLQQHDLFVKMAERYGFKDAKLNERAFQICRTCGATTYSDPGYKGYIPCNIPSCVSLACRECVKNNRVHHFEDMSGGSLYYGVLVCDRHKTCEGCRFAGHRRECEWCHKTGPKGQ